MGFLMVTFTMAVMVKCRSSLSLTGGNHGKKRTKRGRLLLVDDDGFIRRSFARLLANKYDVACAASGDEARDLLNNEPKDLVLLDIDLGWGSPTGLDCLRWIPETGHSGAVCMLTAFLSPELMHEALLSGADDYLIKCGDWRLRAEVDRLVDLGRLPPEQRPRYKTIADPGTMRTLGMNVKQIGVVLEMLERGFPMDKVLAGELGLGVKALGERIARIEGRFGTTNRRQLIRYLTVLAGYVRRSQLEWGGDSIDHSSLLTGATSFKLPQKWGKQQGD